MKVYKFGGASVNSAEAVRNVKNIIENTPKPLAVVVSAMGKTTNLLERLIRAYFNNESTIGILGEFISFHINICEGLFDSIPVQVEEYFKELGNKLLQVPSLDYNYEYDQIIGFGELVSTTIISDYLNSKGVENKWIDIRTCLKTDNTFRAAKVDWEWTEKLMQETINFQDSELYITQGFLGATTANISTSLGREGSDFTAAILGNVLEADDVAIWKDVPGILNGDPKFMSATTKIDELSYKEAIELSYSGAQVIHPKTMKPLHNKGIPLLVKSFLDPDSEGTIIHAIDRKIQLPPVYIQKNNQALITISPKNFSFISIEDINVVVEVLSKNRVSVNLIQQSAIDFNLVVDMPESDIMDIIKKIPDQYTGHYNTGLTLFTIRHFTNEAISETKEGKKVYLEQNSRLTARLLVKQ